MTLENARNLLKHFEEVAEGEDYSVGVKKQAAEQVEVFKDRVARKEKRKGVAPVKEETKSKEKK